MRIAIKYQVLLGLVFASFAVAGDDESMNCENMLNPSTQSTTNNPLLDTSRLYKGALPFDKVQADQFKPAFTTAFAQARARLDAIRNNKDAATFANTIDALEAVDEPLSQVSSVFGNYLSMATSPEVDALATEINPQLSRFSNEIMFDAVLFKRVSALHAAKDRLGLTTEQATLLDKTYRGFVRNGALLNEAQKKRVSTIDEELSVLAEEFKRNVSTAVNTYELIVTDKNRLAGLPQSALDAAAATAAKKGKPNAWVFTLQAPSYIPLLTYADDSSLREELWRAYATKATSGSNDNRPVVIRIAKLRQERAAILGYKSHFDYTTEDRMAHNAATVEAFLGKLANVYRVAAQSDYAELQAFAGRELESWDVAYYSEKLQEQKYGYSEEQLREYFVLENVIKGAFLAATKRYGVTFHQRTDVPVWHEQVTAYEVKDADGSYVGLFYYDPHPRESKRQGAWMNGLQDAGLFAGTNRRPHIVNVTNFTEAVGSRPALLTLNEVTTLFHELGHGLHGLLSKTNYRSLAGTNVAWDFVELPSQINERWALEPEVLDVMALHYQTGERIPAELVAKVKRAENFQAGLIGLRQVSFAMLDMSWHNPKAGRDLSHVVAAEDVERFEREALEPYRIRPHQPGAVQSASFSHIFAGGYSGGYYSYKWADVLAADSFAVFEADGVFNVETARRFREEILERGGSEDAAVLYRRWRGSDPDPDALLRKEGLLSP